MPWFTRTKMGGGGLARAALVGLLDPWLLSITLAQPLPGKIKDMGQVTAWLPRRLETPGRIYRPFLALIAMGSLLDSTILMERRIFIRSDLKVLI